MAVLRVLKGSLPGQYVELHGERMVLGRHPSCRIVLDNSAVSRRHAQILESHGSYFLEDMRSRNGTLLNGEKIHGRMELHDNDEIQVCDAVFRFHEGVDSEALARSGGDTSASGVVPALRDTRMTPANYFQESDPQLPKEPAESEISDHSSIVSTFNVSSMRNLRLAVKPEAKLRAILEISNNLGKLLRLDQLLPKILESLYKIFPQADRGFVLLKDPDTGKLVVKGMKLRNEEGTSSVPISKTIVKKAMQTCEAVLSENAAEDKRFDSSESVANLKIHSLMCVPLIGQGGEAMGVIQIDTNDIRYLFTQDDLDLLASVACQAALAVENAYLHEEVLERRELERDLEFATQVQLGFLPTERPHFDDYQFYDFYEAAHRVGGDLFDYVMLTDGRVALTIGDVAGKGVPAALLMARLYSMARYHLLTEPTAARALTALNAGIATSGLGHRFITYAIAILDAKANTLTIVNAGHLPPLLRSRSGHVEPLAVEESGLPLGVKVNYAYQQTTVDFRPGDTLVLFTDGVTEAMNPQNEIYGTRRMKEFIGSAEGNVEELGEELVADVERFCAGRPQRDDICLVCVRRTPKS